MIMLLIAILFVVASVITCLSGVVTIVNKMWKESFTLFAVSGLTGMMSHYIIQSIPEFIRVIGG